MNEELKELEELAEEELTTSENMSGKEAELPIRITPKKNRIIVMQAGDIVIEDEPARKGGFIGGHIYARNARTDEEVGKIYKTLHDGSTNKWKLAGELLKQLMPPEKEKTKKENIDN